MSPSRQAPRSPPPGPSPAGRCWEGPLLQQKRQVQRELPWPPAKLRTTCGRGGWGGAHSATGEVTVADRVGGPARAAVLGSQVLHQGKEPEGGVERRVSVCRGEVSCESGEPRSVPLNAGLVEGQGGKLWGHVRPLSASRLARAQETCIPQMKRPVRVGGRMTSDCQRLPAGLKQKASAAMSTSTESAFCALTVPAPPALWVVSVEGKKKKNPSQPQLASRFIWNM